MNDKVIVFDTARYMIEDGPGIRDAIFFKGCPLRCKWCSNPFGLMVKRQIACNRSKCVGCGACAAACPLGIISLHEDGHAYTDCDKCQACGRCAEVCLSQARTVIGREMTVQDVLDFITPDIPYFNRSGGGITLSGGEILCQPEMAVKILAAAKDMMVHRAIETSGYGKWEDLERILALTNVAFMDLKHMNPETHKELTGVENHRIIENIQKAAAFCHRKGVQLVVRIPVIPGLNDSAENLIQSAKFVASLEGDVQVNLLPYHNLGESKYEMIGEVYQASHIKPHENGEVRQYRDLMEAHGCECTVGGANVRYRKNVSGVKVEL